MYNEFPTVYFIVYLKISYSLLKFKIITKIKKKKLPI